MIQLPICSWREEQSRDHFLCHSPRFVNGPNLVRGCFCAECAYANQAAPPPLPPALPCVHLGERLQDNAARRAREEEACPVFVCAVHGCCTTSVALPGISHICVKCSD